MPKQKRQITANNIVEGMRISIPISMVLAKVNTVLRVEEEQVHLSDYGWIPMEQFLLRLNSNAYSITKD